MDAEEYNISKYFIIQFTCSAPVLSAAENKLFIIVAILKFICCYVFVYEDQHLHCLRMGIPTMYVSHGTL